MNEWASIRFMFSHRFKTGVLTFLVTFLGHDHARPDRPSSSAVSLRRHLHQPGGEPGGGRCAPSTWNACGRAAWISRPTAATSASPYLTGPLFFASTNTFNEAFAHEEDVDYLVLSMRAVPLIDLSGIEALQWSARQPMAARARRSCWRPSIQRSCACWNGRAGRHHRQGELLLERRPGHPRSPKASTNMANSSQSMR